MVYIYKHIKQEYTLEYIMGKGSKKLNFLIENRLCLDLEDLVPAGKRSNVVNEALRKELEIIRRKKAVETFPAKSDERHNLSTHEIVERSAEDRGSH